MEQGKILASQRAFLQGDALRSTAGSLEPTVELRHYDPRRLGYSLSRHPAAQFERCKTSGGSPPLQHRDVLRSSGSMFFCTDADGAGLPHAEAKLALFKKKYQELSMERAFPAHYEVKATAIQQRVKTALKDIVQVEESKRSGQRDEDGELIQVIQCCAQCFAVACWIIDALLQSTLVISCGPQRVSLEVSAALASCAYLRFAF